MHRKYSWAPQTLPRVGDESQIRKVSGFLSRKGARFVRPVTLREDVVLASAFCAGANGYEVCLTPSPTQGNVYCPSLPPTHLRRRCTSNVQAHSSSSSTDGRRTRRSARAVGAEHVESTRGWAEIGR